MVDPRWRLFGFSEPTNQKNCMIVSKESSYFDLVTELRHGLPYKEKDAQSLCFSGAQEKM